jgi:hypothetical protein
LLSILLPVARRSTPEEAQTCWGDLRVALASIAAYAPEADLVVAWNGLEEPRDLPPNPKMRLIRQAKGITTASAAWNFCAAQTDADELVVTGDDVVFHPDTLQTLLADVSIVREQAPDRPIGFMAARSNYVKGAQNIRCPNNGQLSPNMMSYDSESTILTAPMVVPIASWIEHETFDRVGGFPNTNWFGDDLMCWDLLQLGYVHFVSRAYVHHVGERSTAQGKSWDVLLAEGLAWLSENRPDFHALITGSAA